MILLIASHFVIQSMMIHKLDLKRLIAVNQVNPINWNWEPWMAGTERRSADFPNVCLLLSKMMRKLHK